jgi:hypothetical protein
MRHRDRCIDMAGKTTLPQLAWLLAQLHAFVSVDSGPAHLANAIGTATVVLFGAGDEARTAPWNATRLRVLRACASPCQGCGENECRKGTPWCVEDIETERVSAAIRELTALDTFRGPAPGRPALSLTNGDNPQRFAAPQGFSGPNGPTHAAGESPRSSARFRA